MFDLRLRLQKHLAALVETTPMDIAPFPHLELSNVFPAELYSEVIDNLPETRFYGELKHADALLANGSSARRDSYYSIGSLPADAVHPHTYERGIVPWCDETILGGFRSEGYYAIALHKGGERNGVLTAVEDFMAVTPGYELILVPAIFGLGLLIPADHPQKKDLHAILEPYDRNPLLAKLEANRIENYLEVIRLQDELARSLSKTTENQAKSQPLP